MANYTNVNSRVYFKFHESTANLQFRQPRVRIFLFFVRVNVENIPLCCLVSFHSQHYFFWTIQRSGLGGYIFYRFSLSQNTDPSHVVGYIHHTFYGCISRLFFVLVFLTVSFEPRQRILFVFPPIVPWLTSNSAPFLRLCRNSSVEQAADIWIILYLGFQL